jgi:hypothetical protein
MMQKLLSLSALLLTFILVSPLSYAQSRSADTPDQLFQTIQALDTRLFDAYNHCDLPQMSSMIAEDLEFYHDKTGLALGRQALLDGIKNNICGKVTRELVPGTLEVYPIAHYGAVEIGVHTFHHPGHPENVGEAKFVQLWQNKNGNWQLTRVISFDHHAANSASGH